MAPQYTRADALREYLTGAAADGGVQTNPSASLGNYRSSSEAVSLGITILNPIAGVEILYAGGANPPGDGTLASLDANTLTWKPAGSLVAGPPAQFSGTNDVEIVEGIEPAQYLRVKGTTPFTAGQSTIVLDYLVNNVFGFDDVDIASAASGVTQYRATIVRNESSGTVADFRRWLALLGTAAVSNAGWLGATGSGSIVTTSSFADWPSQGWCQVRDDTGTLREIVYYSSRTNTSLDVQDAGRALLGTTMQAGSVTDAVFPTPGVIIGKDPAGVQAAGSFIQTVAGQTTAPAGVIWNRGISGAFGLQIGSLGPGQQVGVWMRRQIPLGAVATPAALTQFVSSFSAY